ncbi:MAG: SGNH/GDSL hydrolase family protein [Eubacteriales bacterium]
MEKAKDGYIYFDPMKSHAKIYGLIPGEYARAPEAVRKLMNEGLRGLSLHTSGGRIRFNTNSEKLAVKMEVTGNADMSHMPLSGSSGLDFFEGTGKNMKYITTRQPTCSQKKLETEVALSKGEKTVTIYLPLYNGVRSLKIGLEKGASVTAPPPYTFEKPVVFYGSSITQGGCATRTANSYCAMLAKIFDSDFINLGFSGSAQGEPFMAEYIAGLDMSCFILDYDHNAPNADHLRKTHLPFVQTILAKQPKLPIIMLSKPDTNFTTDLERRDVVLDSYKWMVANGYEAYFVDGGDLFGTAGRDCCTVDGCHPNDLGFYRMAEAVVPALGKVLG